ncbi:alpha/beta hydrolase [Sinomicrobium weinanense]|uniref:Esterase family protein n=1 Tax=Sinomicrobium weinanense TaxID=2842200 RepID=A0A926Q3P7_9FLAO|nr:alpha/beta hydrolase-fold protein [Sinomicrobium weinanense]MBC9796226.1 esterase family protein [Sinomicrobium weinanense]MBU3122319.1 esterase family protein [Sinomicrobium weinanense]
MNFRNTYLCVFLLLGIVHAACPQSEMKPPEGFDTIRKEISRGRIETIEYPSKTVGTNRKVTVYTPPGFSEDQKYNVLYLLHGIGGDETEWYYHGNPGIILDNLYAENKLAPMIVVMPNGRAMKDDRVGDNMFDKEKLKAFADFESDLIRDLIPFIEANYPVYSNRENRGLAGLSMGGGQALNFGLHNLGAFAWIGAFSPAPNTWIPEKLVPRPGKVIRKLKLLWISCGNEDELLYISERTHNYLGRKGVPHTYYVEPGKHDFTVWKNDLYQFSQLLFR